MLFLAVFCGFMAENQREHFVEHQREKKFMITLLEDLKVDTTQLQRLHVTLKRVVDRRDSIRKYLKPPVNDAVLKEYWRESMTLTLLVGYTYNDRTIDQLRSSGNYRLIRKKNVTDSLILYDTRMRGIFTKNYNNLYESRLQLMNLQADILDFSLWGEGLFDETYNFKKDSIGSSKLPMMQLLTDDQKLLFHYYNYSLLHMGFNRDVNQWVERMKRSAENLIRLIQKEYKLK